MITPQMKKFGQEYINKRDENKAAIAAGVSPKFATKIGKDWLQNPEVMAYINSEIDKSAEKVKITRDWILSEAKKVYDNSTKSADQKAALELIDKLLTKQEMGGTGEVVPQINIYSESDINIL